MEMQPPAQRVVVGAAVEKRFPGYGTYRGTIEEISGGKVVVHWAATDERTSQSSTTTKKLAIVAAATRRMGRVGVRVPPHRSVECGSGNFARITSVQPDV